jgi:hypothetical protein
VKRSGEPLNHYLLIFDHSAGKLVSHEEFDEVEAALDAYEHAETSHDRSSNIEVVLVGSDSFETVRETHANYFDGTAALAKALVTIMRQQQQLA